MIVCLMGMTIRTDLMGVSSIVRALGLVPTCYNRILNFFHSPALCLDKLTQLWRSLVFKQPGVVRMGGRPVLLAAEKIRPKIAVLVLARSKGGYPQPTRSGLSAEHGFGMAVGNCRQTERIFLKSILFVTF